MLHTVVVYMWHLVKDCFAHGGICCWHELLELVMTAVSGSLLSSVSVILGVLIY